MVMNISALKKQVQAVISELDHKHIDQDHPYFGNHTPLQSVLFLILNSQSAHSCNSEYGGKLKHLPLAITGEATTGSHLV